MVSDAVLERVRGELQHVRVPSPYDRVYKDECMFSFCNPESTDGIYVSLKTWQGVGRRYLHLDNQRTGSGLYYNEVHTRVPYTDEEMAELDAPPTAVAIGGSHGFNVDKKAYRIEKAYNLVIFPEMEVVALPCPELPELVLNAIAAIQKNEGATRQDQTATWEHERKESKYARSLVQLEAERSISPDPAQWRCDFTGVTENLWLNLSTGKIGSGRRHWDGTGGNGAALKHFEQTGSQYPLVVKLGTITPHSADVYSYAPDEDDLVLDPLLQQHLAHWGINMLQMEKTVKTMAELEVDLNVKFEYNAITEGGAELKPAMGPGRVGLENLGNYCYMSSTLQALWGVPAFAKCYLESNDKVMTGAAADVAQDFPIQFQKVGRALAAGETDKVPFQGHAPEPPPASLVEANAVAPHRFKALIGRGHPDFGTTHQQDACEFFLYLLEMMGRSEFQHRRRLPEATDMPPCSSLFMLMVEQRTQCAATGAVSYKQSPQFVLSLDIPLEAASNRQEVEEYQKREETRRQAEGSEAAASTTASAEQPTAARSEEEDPVIPLVPMDACLSRFTAETVLKDYFSPALGGRGQGQQTNRIAAFPPYLMIHMRKYYVDDMWRPCKMDVLVGMRHSINIEALRASGPQPHERMQPDTPDAPGGAGAAAAAPAPGPAEPSPEIVSALTAAGFHENACKRAAITTGNTDVEAAMNWLLEHMDDPDLNEPVVVEAGGGERAGGAEGVDAAAMEQLTSMGFTERQVKAALQACNQSVERAADWLFSRMDNLESEVARVEGEAADQPPGAAQPNAPQALDGEGKYELVGIISHIGKNTACGHYVAHVKKQGQWYIFNDDKVALSERLPIEHGYMYLYRRMDQPWS